jgi:hypothetical protein
MRKTQFIPSPRVSNLGLRILSALLLTPALVGAKDILHSFVKYQLNNQLWADGTTFGDFNHDGINDIVSGPYWYEGPGFTNRHEFYPADTTFKHKKADGTEEAFPGFEGAFGVNNAYSDNFFAFTYDFNHGGWPDIHLVSR